MFLFNNVGAQTITVLRQGKRDWKGDVVPGELTVSHTISNVLVETGAIKDNQFLQDQATTNGTFYMPMGSDVKANDRVELEDGTPLTVFGKPFTYNMGLVRGTAVRYRGYSND